MDAPEFDEVLLDAAHAVVLAALERIGDDSEARFWFFRRLLAVAQREAAGGFLLQAAPPGRSPQGCGREANPATA